MSADPRFDHDVFISYASVDNPSSHSWITHFVSNLTELLAIEYGFNNDDRIWWDQLHIDKETSLTEQISRRVRRSACIVVVLSAGYACRFIRGWMHRRFSFRRISTTWQRQVN